MKSKLKRVGTLGVILTLSVSLGLGNCKKKDDDNDELTFLLLAAAYLLSGHCVELKKTADNTYQATGNTVPRGGCSEATFEKIITADSAAVVTASNAQYDLLLAELAGTSCSTTKTTQTTNKDTITSSAVTTAVDTPAGTTYAPKCNTTAGGKNLSPGGSMTPKIVACKDESAATAYRALRRYVAVSDVKTDMAKQFVAKSTSTETGSGSLKLNQANNKFTDDAITNARLSTSAELSAQSGAPGTATFQALGEVACAKAIADAYPAVKSALTNVYGSQLTQFISSITEADVKAVTSAAINSITCTYGTAAAAETASQKKCDASYETF